MTRRTAGGFILATAGRLVAGRIAAGWLVVVAALLAAAGGPAAGEPARRELRVFAAASLRESFTALAAAFERAHPGVKVTLNLAGSQELRTQIEQGAVADVFASADTEHMARLTTQKLVHAPVVFVRNEPVIVVGNGNPFGVRSLAELGKVKRLVVGAPEVPIGRYTSQILQKYEQSAPQARAAAARIRERVVSRELNVRQVLAKVVLGEADAGIVYRTDGHTAAGKVEVVVIDRALNVVADYPVAALVSAPQRDLARDWIALLRAPAGHAELKRAGFLVP